MNNFDKKCLQKAIDIANDTFKQGNFPVGAVLAIDEEIIDIAGNEINTKKSYVNHAENSLIIRNGSKLADAYKQGKSISLYSTLEPCIQCLGASVTNHINRILYIQKDPNGGACDLKHSNIGLWYKKTWPEILYVPFSTKPKELMFEFFESEIEKGNTKWPRKMLELLSTSPKKNRIVIAGSVSFQEAYKEHINGFEKRGLKVIDWPVPINTETFIQDYPVIHKDFYKKITEADYLFIMNEDKKDIEGYLGAETFAELAFGVAQKLLNGQDLEIVLYKMPSEEVQSVAEIKLWLELGWITLYDDSALSD